MQPCKFEYSPEVWVFILLQYKSIHGTMKLACLLELQNLRNII